MTGKQRSGFYLGAFPLLVVLFAQSEAYTDPLEVEVLQDVFKALNCPQRLKGWKLNSGDPCGESWMGVSCSGSSIVELRIPGLRISGSLGSQLHHLHNLKIMDVSFNFLQGEIPYGLPPNATHIDMAYNNLSQSIPYSLALLTSLQYLNLSHNSLSGPLGNVFSGLQIREMDLAFNNLTGDLPSSFGSLMNLTSLYLQNNRFTGSVIYLADLPLIDLNIEDNQFSGIFPSHFQTIPHLQIWGNNFHIDPNYKPWRFPLDIIPMMQNASGLPTTQSSAIKHFPGQEKHWNHKKRMGAGSVVLLVGGMAFLGTFMAVFAIRCSHQRARNLTSHRSNFSSAHSLPVRTTRDYQVEDSPQIMRVRHPPIRIERTSRRKSFSETCQVPAYGKQFSVAELQLATNNFSEENLLAEGPLGSVYRAKLPDGQFSAVKNIPMASLSLHEEEQFMEVLQTASKLRHPNIVALLGFCIENGKHLLAYEYVGHLSLYKAMHDEGYKPLSWSLRLQIAIGVARALEYLHSSFSPPIAHRDLKAENILLDEELTPRIADCGLASLRPLTSNSVKQRASEIAIHNTGYIAPEHGQPGSSGTKSDVYAFGVLLLELLTGRKPFDSSRPRDEQLLVKWASCRLHDRRSLEKMIDPGIAGTFSLGIASQFADIVSLCTQAEKEFRPPVSEIVKALTDLMQKQRKEASSVGADWTEADPFSKSFRTTRTRFMVSPTVSYLSD
ncbi:PREDICTED: protein STRUBBELIG-RECEPTOR FAMILY 2-like isoform X2 [Tarenaya hassleriana]|uniref:protein STRUBBELIG-RECEPTOR FAMILY 2-like isoform X2 n=1 Tax=Tarenaya hassleriana TaxID=28532 RepID=UPI00053C236B|nr:PREDICTED: protein STRUBBELIG-RECEPTOR FAMILY 2-like isoform X2 [Tarenaya hassleriana]